MGKEANESANVQPVESESTVQENEVGSLTELIEFSQTLPEVAEVEAPENEEAEETEEVAEEVIEPVDEEADELEEEAEAETDEVEEDPEEKESISVDEMKKGQKYINQKIGKQVKARKEAEEQAESYKQRVESLQQQVDQVQQVDRTAQLQHLGLNPALAMAPRELANQERTLRSQLGQLKALSYNPDGYEENGQEFTQQEVIATMGRVELQLEALGEVKSLAMDRAKVDAATKEIYPELFETTSEVGQEYQRALNNLPGLAGTPSSSLMVGDMMLGRQVRAALGKEKGAIMPRVKTLLKGGSSTPRKKPPNPKPSPAVKPTPKPAVNPAAAGQFDASAVKKAGTFEELEKQSRKMM